MTDLVQLSGTASASALVFGTRRVSYAEFGARVSVLARELIAAGVGPDVAVGVCIERSVELLVGIHAVVAAGGHYVPLDTAAPAKRVAYMMETSGARTVLVSAGRPPAVIESLRESVRVIDVDAAVDVDLDTPPITDEDRRAPLEPDHAAYTLFTSGSTGRPKGVTVSHRAIVNRLGWMREWYSIKESDVFLQKTPVTFDVSVWELFLPLAVGASLVIVEPDRHGDPLALAEIVVAERVTVVHFVPSMLAAFLDVLGPVRVGDLVSLRLMFTSGEALTAATAQAVLSALPAVELHNLYGPTEAAVDVTAHHVAPGESVVPIGVPVPSTSTYVLDARLQLVPAGVPGELYLGGVQLARGYAGQAGLTSERFVADRYGDDGGRLYRTGDLVRWNASGEIEYLGRTDFQVKLRGQRLELGEVEAVISEVPGVVHVAATVARAGADDQLVAYVAPETVDLDEVRAAVARALPEYMRPTVWMPLERMPLNSAGKVARRELPAPELGVAEYVAPESDMEAMVAAVFGGALGLDQVSVVESFFELGGNSLSATRVAARLADTLDLDVSVRDLFDTPTVRELVLAVAGRGRTLARLTAVDRPERLPLSTAQARMWFINQFDPASPAYNIPMGLRLTGDLDPAALRDAVGDVIERHEVLRTVYPSDTEGPFQQIVPAEQAREMLDWLDASDDEELIGSATRGFDVTRELPIRGRLKANADGTLDVVITAHHIAFDGESNPVFVRDLLAAYLRRTGVDPQDRPPLPVQYADFALWQRSVLGDAGDPDSRMGAELAYWRTALADLPSVTNLPMDRPRPGVLETAAGLVSTTVDDAVAEALEVFAREHEVTPFMVSHAALAIAVSRLASTTDVVIGAPIAGRNDAALQELIGMFVNTLVLRTRVDPSQSLADFVRTVRSVDVDAFANSDVQFDDLVEELAPERSTAYQPLVQIAFTHESGDTRHASGALATAGLDAQALATAEPVAKFELTVGVTDRSADAPMAVNFLYATSLFDEATVQRFASVWLQVITAMVTDPQEAIGDVDILDEFALDWMRPSRKSVGGFGTADDGGVTEPRTLVEVLASRPANPVRAALVCDGAEVSYAEFDERTNRVARQLIAHGVGPDDIVAVGLERSIASVIAVFGVVRTGAAYVPIDPSYPQDRIDYMIADSGVRWGITDIATRPRLGESSCEWLDIDEMSANVTVSGAPVTEDDRRAPVRLDNLAYLVYTSGSTGRPKAVGVTNRGIANFIDALGEVSGTPADNPDVRVLHVASPSFDASVLEMMWSIGLGHTLVIAPASEYAGDALGRILERDQVTDTLITPTVLATVDPARGRSLRNLVTGGEACPPELVARWAAVPGRRMFNFYGPSEATVWSSTGRTEPGRRVTIGRPVRGFSAYVLDGRLHQVPRGVVGELYLSAPDSLARGYLGRAGQTAGAFVADPFSPEPGRRMYATGDMVRLTGEGEIEFAGRADDQVKINGQRVELGEIEAVLADQPGVDSAVVLGVRDESGRNRLVAYLVAARVGDTTVDVDVDAVLAGAASRLAGHMVPPVAVVLDELPVTPGGKLDRRALLAPDLTTDLDQYVAPVNSTEETLASIVAGLLGLERVGVTESFFALGGDSIMSIQLASAAKASGLVLSPREIFEHKTIRAMAQAVATGGAQLPMLAEPAGGGSGELALPPIVSWMVETSSRADVFADFNQSMVLVAPVGLTGDALAEVLTAVVAAHPMLTARLDRDEDRWTMTAGVPFDPASAVRVHRVDVALGTEAFGDALRAAHVEAARRLDPSTGNLVQAVLVTDVSGAGRIVLVIHHLGVDAVSWPILIEDLVTVWAQRTNGHPIAVRAEQTSARAWVHALDEQIQQRHGEIEHWLTQLPGRPTDFGAALDPERDRYAATASIVHRVPAEVTEAVVTSVPHSFGGNVNDVLLATLARAVRSWQADRGLDDDAPVTILSEGHGRYEDVVEAGPNPRRADLSRTVGWFTTIAPVAVDPAVDVVHAVKAAKEARLATPDHGVGFGLLRYGAESPLATRPLPSIAFNYLGNRGGAGVDDQATATIARSSQVDAWLPAGDAPFLPSTIDGAMPAMATLTINASTAPGPEGRVLSAEFRFAQRIVSDDDVRDIATRWSAELAGLVGHLATHGNPGLSPSDVRGSGVTQEDLDAIEAAYPGARIWPLSPLQRGLYFQAAFADDDAVDVYLTQTVLHIDGDVDLGRLRTAADDLLAHHATLRSGFVRALSGRPIAIVPARVEVPWESVQFDETDGAADLVAELARQQLAVPFDLDEPPLLRVVAVQYPGGVSVVITNHHILFDGWSGPLVMADLLALYATGGTYTGQVAHTSGDFEQYLDFVASHDESAGIAAWKKVLAPVEGPTLVAPGVEATTTLPPQEYSLALDEALTSAIESVAREHNATVATVLQLGWALFLSKLVDARVVTFGETVSGRPAELPDVETLVGLFINTLPVVVDVDPDAAVGDLLQRLQSDKVSVIDHQYSGLPEILAATDAQVAFDTLTVHESYPVRAESLAGGGAAEGLAIRGVDVRDATHYPLTLVTSQAGGSLTLKLKYLPGAFGRSEVEAFVGTLAGILARIAESPATTASEVTSLGFSESAPTSEVGFGEATAPVVLGEMFRRAARQWPEQTAVADGSGSSVTYAELDARSDKVAQWLVRRGVGVESLVALAIPRSVGLLTAIWAVAKTGAGYVPIDPEYPADRVAHMVEISGARVGLAAEPSELPDLVDWMDFGRVLDDAAAEADAADTVADALARVRPENVAYVIFTSGSTGRPKGVSVTHTGLANFANQEALRLGAPDGAVVLGFASPSFDASVLEYLLATVTGGKLAYRPADAVGGTALVDHMRLHRVTHTFLTPSVLSTLDPSQLPDLQAVAAGGELVPRGLVDAWSPHTSMHNLYGPTETTIGVTISEKMVAGDPVRLGGPIDGIRLEVLDERLRAVPLGVPGELYVTGPALSRGYLAQSGLTASRFVADPAASGERMYRTGDVVRWRRTADEPATLEYLGRSDDQIKLRGLRIELGEIEAVLTEHHAVRSAVVVGVGEPAITALVGYVVTSEPVSVVEMRNFVGHSLPGYMVPSTIVTLNELPLTPVGKLDRTALPPVDIRDLAGEMEGAATDDEATAAAVFAEVLGVDEFGVTTSFFDAGGNSLSAMRVAARVAEALGVEVSVRDLFEAPTVRDLVSTVSRRSAGVTPVVAVTPRPERIPLSFAQQRMWFINQLEPNAITYNIPAVLHLTGRLDIEALRSALVDVVRRHEVLRTTFPAHEGVPHQLVSDEADVPAQLDWVVVDTQDGLETALTTGFDVATQWPLRARLWKTGVDEHVFALVVHHIAADGQSMGPLVGDIVAAYSARASGHAPDYSPLEVQFADFAIWQHTVLGSPEDVQSAVGAQLAYWTETLAGLPDVLELPTDRPRPPVASHRGRQVGFEIPAEVTTRIAEVASERGVTPFMVVHAALAVLLARLSATDDIAIATPIAGRGQQVLEPLVGMFVNTLVLRTAYDPGKSFEDLLDEVRTTDLDAFAHADVPFETLVETLNPMRSQAFSPLAQVILSFDQSVVAATASPELAGTELAGLAVSSVTPPEVPAHVDLTVTVGAGEPGRNWSGTLTYATDLFDEPTMVDFADRLLRVLAECISEPSRVVGDSSLLSSVESAAIDDLPKAVRFNPHRSSSVVDMFARVAKERRRHIAVTAGDRHLSYRELDELSTRLARRLVERGVSDGSFVGICVRRDAMLPVCVLAVMKAGAAYVPLDSTNPSQRLHHIVEDSAPVITLIDASTAGLFVEEGWGAPVADVHDLLAEAEAESVPELQGPVSVDAPAYVIYTSGSTGLPKGVVVTHRDVVALMDSATTLFSFDEDDVWTMFHSYAFDFSVWEIWGPLLWGGRLVIVDREAARSPEDFLDLLAEEKVTVLSQTPSAFYQLADARLRNDRELSLRYVVFGGEALSFDQVRRWYREFPEDSAQLVNMYGITETTVHVTFRALDPDSVADHDRSLVGKPIPDLEVHVLDARLHPVPPGVTGELYVAGAQLAQAYHNRPGLTAGRFVANPFGQPGDRLYRTGDLGRRIGDEIEYLGRGDAQVQLRGFRIELGEVEAALRGAAGVASAAAAVRTSGGDEHLVGYIVAEDGDVDLRQIRADAAGRVPAYMVPDLLVVMDALPLTSNGKLDRRGLPEPRYESSVHVEPANDLERSLAEAFEEILGVERVSVTDSFFESGGNSLSAVRLLSRLRDRGHEIELARLFSHPSVRELAQRIASSSSDVVGEVLIGLRADGSREPLFCVHPAGGLAWFYGGFVPYVSDRPIFGLQDPHVVAGEDVVENVEAYAARYVEEIRRVQPEGPYHLLGWSLGGYIAHAMATLLQKHGDEVGFLGIMDASPMVDTLPEPPTTESADSAEPFAAELASDLLGGWRDLFSLDESVQVSSPDEVEAVIRGQIEGMGLLAEGQVDRIMESFAEAPKVAAGHRPEIFEGSITLFTAVADKPEPGRLAENWRPYVTGQVQKVDVDTYHLGMANTESLAVIGPVLETELSAAYIARRARSTVDTTTEEK